MINIDELRKKSERELQVMLAEARELLRELRFKDANRQLRDVRQIRKIRVKIARILTVLNNKQKEQKDEKR